MTETTLQSALYYYLTKMPTIMATFAVLNSIYEYDLRGIFFLIGMIITTVIIVVIKFVTGRISPSPSPNVAPDFCYESAYNFLIKREHSGIGVSLVTALMGYTTAYMLIPMVMYKTYNIPVIVLLSATTLIIALLEAATKCSGMGNSFAGVILGGGLGFLLNFLFVQISPKTPENVLYFAESNSSRVSCKKESNTKMKCKVYKNGELIKTNV